MTPIIVRCITCRHRIGCPLRTRGAIVRCPFCRCHVCVPISNSDAIDAAEPAISLNPVAWQVQCRTAITVASDLLRATGCQVTGWAVVELIRQIPRPPQGLRGLSSQSLLFRGLQAVARNEVLAKSGKREAILRFVRTTIELPSSHRGLLEASVTGSLLGFGLAGRSLDS